MVAKYQAGPLMNGAPKVPQAEPAHKYLGAHKQTFPTGYISMKPQMQQIERAPQGVVGADVAKRGIAGN